MRQSPGLITRMGVRAPALLAALLLGGIALFAVIGPTIVSQNPQVASGPALIEPISELDHPLGTDALGRDILAGVANGARVSLTIGLAVAILSVSVGVMLGALAGYAGGFVDMVISGVIEVFQTIPGLVFLIVLVAFLSPSVTTIVFSLALVSWDSVARITRAEVRGHRNRDYVQASLATGQGHLHTVFREILPNVAPALIATASVIVASAILSESALSFLGLGDPNIVSWGGMIGDGREFIRTAPYLTIVPGLFIGVTVLALNVLSDELNDYLNPRNQR